MQLAQEGRDTVGKLYMHPGDRRFKATTSANLRTQNIMLKITVPKRTGLKRRRGAQGPYYDGLAGFNDHEAGGQSRPASISRDTRLLVRSMRDNVRTYQIEPVGIIGRTHRFRGRFLFRGANRLKH